MKLCIQNIIVILILNSMFITLYSQSTVTQSTAGGTGSSASYEITGTMGQTFESNPTNSENYSFSGGFLTAVMDVQAPNIISDNITTPQEEEQDIPITATITDNFSVHEATLYYRQGGESGFTSLNMTRAGDTFSGTIPGNNVGSRGVEYYITAGDLSANVSNTVIYAIQVMIDEPGIENTAVQPAGKEQSAYRLVSIPLNVTNKNPSDVLDDDLGSYDETKWRFFELKPDQPENDPYKEYPNTSSMDPGKAFWLIVKDADKKIDTGAGVTVLINEEYRIPLNADWTFIGNPFNFDIPYDHVTMDNDSALIMFSYTGDWDTYSDALRPFEGYAVHCETATNLVINPDLSNVTKASQSKPLTSGDENILWNIKISASCDKATDKNNQIIIHKKSSQQWDRLDRPEPPVIGEYVSVYFPHPEWGKVSSHYCVDARPEPIEGDIWDFMVKTNISNEIKLTFYGIEEVRSDFEIYLIDEQLNIIRNLRETHQYNCAPASMVHPKLLKIMVGDQTFVENKLHEYNLIPYNFTLEQNFPNPFNPLTTIRFGLPKDQKITIKIYNVLGQEIKTLVDNVSLNAGYHSVIWNGKNWAGRSVSSGIYIYLLHTDNYHAVKKMMLVR